MPALNKLTDYATVLMAQLALRPGDVSSASGLAAACGATVATTRKILKILARHGLVQSTRGACGGYALARAPAEISMAQIIEAMEGPLGMTECSVASGLCERESQCLLRPGWQQANAVIRQALDAISLADMALSMNQKARHHRQPDL